MYANAQASLICYTYGKTLSKIKVRVVFNRKNRVYVTRASELLTKDEFEQNRLKKAREARAIAEKDLAVAKSICDELGKNFSFNQFKVLYDERVNGKMVQAEEVTFDTLIAAYSERRKCKPNTIDSYRTAANWILRYNPQLTVKDMTPEIVGKVCEYIKKQHKSKFNKEISPNTMGMYIRGLKALYNFAIEQGVVHGTPLQGIKTTHADRRKTALKSDDWDKFKSYSPSSPLTEFAYDFARLSFALCGANFADILALKNRSIANGQVHFVRTKTERVDTNVCLPLIPEAITIFKKYGAINPKKPDAYILPYYSNAQTERQKDFKRKDFLKRVNKGLKLICEEIGIEKFTTYNIRHTFAIFALDKHTPIEHIKLLLGHTSITTTQTYLKSVTSNLMENTYDFLSTMLKKDNSPI